MRHFVSVSCLFIRVLIQYFFLFIFQSTKKFANKTAVMKELEDCGGIFDCRSTR